MTTLETVPGHQNNKLISYNYSVDILRILRPIHKWGSSLRGAVVAYALRWMPLLYPRTHVAEL